MNILSHLKLRAKLTLLLGLSTVAVIVSIGAAASLMHQRMFDDRIAMLRAVVQSTISIAQSLENRVAAHALTREQALALLRDDVHALRFDNGDGYVFAQTLDNIFVLHGANPAMEGKPSPVVNENGRPLTDLISDALRNSDDGTVTYLFPKPGQTERLAKITYVARFAPWDLVFGGGDYVDDIVAIFHTTLLRLSLIGGAIFIVTLVAGWVVNRDVVVSLGSLKTAMDQLAKGNLSTAVPGVDRRDEIGGMAAAVLVFKDGMIETERLRAEHEAVKLKVAAEQKAALYQMAAEFEGKVGHLVGILSSSSRRAGSNRAVDDRHSRAEQQAGHCCFICGGRGQHRLADRGLGC